MKKIFTLLLGTLITAATFAADHRPVVLLKTGSNYEIVIDGKSYYNYNNTMINIGHLHNGRHAVKVYAVKETWFRKSRKLVSATIFRVRNEDLVVAVDFRGHVQVTEARFGRDRDFGWKDHDFGKDEHGRDFGKDDHGRDRQKGPDKFDDHNRKDHRNNSNKRF